MTPNTSPPVEILHIHGGMTFKTHEDYVEYLRTRPVSLGGSEKWI